MPEQIIALVMAGGEGSRMAQAFPSVPKPLVRLAGRPLIEFGLRRLRDHGFTDIRLALRHGAQHIIQYLREDSGLGADGLSFLVEEEPLGTIGSLVELKDEGKTVLVTNADVLSDIDFRAMLRFHRQAACDLTIASHLEYHSLRLGEVVVSSGHRVIGYEEKPIKEYCISSGTYLIDPCVQDLVSGRERLDLPNLVQRALDCALSVLEFSHTGLWLDVNDERDLSEALASLEADPVAFGLDPDGVR